MSRDDETIICATCIGEPFLNALITKDGETGTCDYCEDDEGACVTIDELADHIEGAFERHYYRTSDQPDMYESMLLRDKELHYDWHRDGEPVLYAIQGAASVSEEVAQDVLDILEQRYADFESAQLGEECEFDPDSHYEERSINDREFASRWHEIERSLKTEARYFNRGAETFLAELFGDLENQTTETGDPVIVNAGPDRAHPTFFRARVFHNSDDLDRAMMRPDLHLGPPPASFARAGRMNAHGISMFYGASDKGVALAEVRPPVGSRVLVGEFEVAKPVRLLDVSALEAVYVEGSVFAPNYAAQLSLAKFLGRLSDRIIMPVMPDDEPSEYLITQLIAAYLARKPAPGLDGILFPSVQSPGEHKNVVLFHHASRVDVLDIPADTEFTANQIEWDEDGDRPAYRVWEMVPAKEGEGEDEDAKEGLFAGLLNPAPFDPDADYREPTLRVRPDKVGVLHVSGVAFHAEEHAVNRYRTEKRNWNFDGPKDLNLDIEDDLEPF